MILRALFIAAGVTLLKKFEWITWIFGLFLLYAAWRLVRGGSAHAAIPDWIRKLQPAKGSLLPVILAVEVTDLLFAVDSIPAVLAVSHNPFVVYTSNIAAILGLRSLYCACCAAGPLPLSALWAGRDAGLCRNQDAGRALDRDSHHAFSRGDGRNFDGLCRGFVDGSRQRKSHSRHRIISAIAYHFSKTTLPSFKNIECF